MKKRLLIAALSFSMVFSAVTPVYADDTQVPSAAEASMSAPAGQDETADTTSTQEIQETSAPETSEAETSALTQEAEADQEDVIAEETSVKERAEEETDADASAQAVSETDTAEITDAPAETDTNENTDAADETDTPAPAEITAETSEANPEDDAIILTSENYTEYYVSADNNSDITTLLNNAMKVARDNATEEKPYKIIVSAGSYTISNPVHIYSNTTLVATGCTFTRTGSYGVALCTGGSTGDPQNSGYTDHQNIHVIGGTWIKELGNNSNIFYLIHGTNISLKNCTFDGSEGEKSHNNHLVEASAVNGLTITGCTFQNNVRPSADIAADKYCGGWECLQLDITTQLGDGSIKDHNYLYDGTPSKNITIKNNTFKNASRGIGTHTAIQGIYIENVTIQNNTFANLTDEAVADYHWYNVNISNNIIKNCGRGIYIQSIGKISSSGTVNTFALKPYEAAASGTYTVQKRNDMKTTISNNTITTSSEMKNNCSFGIDIYGATITSKYTCDQGAVIPEGNYEIANVTVTGNTITTNGVGIRARGCYDSVISGNTVKCSGKVYAASQACGISAYDGTAKKTGLTIADNEISGFCDGGILIKSGSCGQDIKDNTISACDDNGIAITDNASVNGNISANTIENAGLYGIYIKNSAVTGSIDSNTITGSTDDSIEIYQSSVKGKISLNTISGSGKIGIRIRSIKSAIVIEGNTIKANNKNYCCHIDAGNKTYLITLSGNKITGNKNYYGVKIDSGKVNIKNNTVTGSKRAFTLYKAVSGSIYANTLKSNADSNNYYLSCDSAKTITALPATVRSFTAKSAKAKTMTLKWKKVSGATAYLISYSTSSNMKNAKTVTISGGTKVKATISKLKSKKTYYFTIQACKKVDNVTLYGKTAAKSAVVK